MSTDLPPHLDPDDSPSDWFIHWDENPGGGGEDQGEQNIRGLLARLTNWLTRHG